MSFFRKNITNSFCFVVVAGLFLLPSIGRADQVLDTELFLRSIEESREGKPSEATIEDLLTTGKIKAKEWHFFYSGSEMFENNIFRKRKKITSDWITRASPGLEGMIQDSQKILRLAANSDIIYYAKNGHMTDWKGFRVTGDTLFFRNSRIKLRLKDTLQRSTYVGNTSHDKTNKWLQNNFRGGIQYDLSPKSTVLVDYTQQILKYLVCTNTQNSYMQHVITPSFLWRLSPKTTFRTSYGFGLAYHPKNSLFNSSFHRFTTGFSSNFTPKSSIDLDVGYTYKRFFSSVTKDVGAFIGLGGYNYKWTKKTSFRLYGGRSIGEATTSGQRYLERTFGGVSINHLFTPKLSTAVSSLYSYSAYPNKSSNAHLIGMNVMVGYALSPLFRITLRYDFLQNLAKTKDGSYQDHKVSLGLNGVF